MLDARVRYTGIAGYGEVAAMADVSGWRDRATITVPEYAAILGIGRNTAYEAVRAGEVEVIRVRGRILVCVPALLRRLGGETRGEARRS
jgi:excisionase family DNA binding protein